VGIELALNYSNVTLSDDRHKRKLGKHPQKATGFYDPDHLQTKGFTPKHYKRSHYKRSHVLMLLRLTNSRDDIPGRDRLLELVGIRNMASFQHCSTINPSGSPRGIFLYNYRGHPG